MNNLFEKFKNLAGTSKKKTLGGALLLLAILCSAYFFDVSLAIGLLFAFTLTFFLFILVRKKLVNHKKAYLLFGIVFALHAVAAIFIYYADFRPSGGGADFETYNTNAAEIAQRFQAGNFSLAGIRINHYYPVLMGVIYALTAPTMVVGQLFSAWLAAVSVLFAYFLVIEIGGSKKSAFIAGLLISLYPSYLYFGSLLLKDTLVVPLVLLGGMLGIKIIKRFDGLNFLLFFAVLTALVNLRFYIGFALMFSFILCWFLLSNLKFSERGIYGLAMVVLLGFSPQIAGLNNYYGTDLFNHYLSRNVVKNYREVIYAPAEYAPIVKTEVSETKNNSSGKKPEEKSGEGSSFVVPSGVENPLVFTKNYIISFTYSLLGPFPWQLKQTRHIYFLADTIPFYIIACGFLYWVFRKIKNSNLAVYIEQYKFSLLLLLFSVMAVGALSLLINNFGIIARIRMPMYIVLVCVAAMSFEDIVLYIKKFKKIS